MWIESDIQYHLIDAIHLGEAKLNWLKSCSAVTQIAEFVDVNCHNLRTLHSIGSICCTLSHLTRYATDNVLEYFLTYSSLLSKITLFA